MSRKFRIAIAGASGYAGAELVRLAAAHPHYEITAVTSEKSVGQAVSAVFPSLTGVVRLTFEALAPDALAERADAVFLALPHTRSQKPVALCLKAGRLVVDLSADYRLKDVTVYEKWYQTAHSHPDLLADAVYGLPEVNRERIRGARLVANPGCYPTAVQLGFLPLVEQGVADLDHLIADAKSGVSGAGRKAELHLGFAEASDNFVAYNIPGHRHWPEIRQGLALAAKREVGLVFTAHLLPIIRGIHATLYARITKEVDFQALFEKRYAREPFVDVMPAGSHPDTRSVRAANVCRLAVHRPPEGAKGSSTLVVLSVIDNLVKGAAGQAVQNMNLMFGLAETTGLMHVPVVP